MRERVTRNCHFSSFGNPAGRLFQAAMWREYAMAWDGRATSWGTGSRWVKEIMRVPRAECLRRSRINVYLAKRLNRVWNPTTKATGDQAE